MNLNNASALGTGPLTISGGSIDNTSASNLVLSTNNGQYWNGDFAYVGSLRSLNLGTGTVSLWRQPQRDCGRQHAHRRRRDQRRLQPDQIGRRGAGARRRRHLWRRNHVNAGALSFANTAAKPSSGAVNVAAGATLGLGVGTAAPYFNSTNVNNLFLNNMAGVSMNSTSNVGIDTTAGNFTYSSNIPATTMGLTKLGPNTLTLTGVNSYSGTTSVFGGALSLANATAYNSMGVSVAARRAPLAFQPLQWHERLDGQPDRQPVWQHHFCQRLRLGHRHQQRQLQLRRHHDHEQQRQ